MVCGAWQYCLLVDFNYDYPHKLFSPCFISLEIFAEKNLKFCFDSMFLCNRGANDLHLLFHPKTNELMNKFRWCVSCSHYFYNFFNFVRGGFQKEKGVNYYIFQISFCTKLFSRVSKVVTI